MESELDLRKMQHVEDMEDERQGALKLDDLLRNRLASFSKSERRIASYFINNMSGIQFETGASIARAVGVSEMTVSRFIRTIGFENLKALKQSLRVDVSQRIEDIDDYMARFQLRGPRQKERRESLRLELEAVARAYLLSTTPNWDTAIDRLAEAETIFVLGFNTSKGLAMDLACRLTWIRPRVVFIGGDSATYGEVLMSDPKTSVVILIETAAYASRAVKLAERLKAQQMPLVILTDKFSLWGWSYTGWVFEAHTYVKTFWDSTAGLAVLANLMLDGIATRLGTKARSHFQHMAEAGQLMGDFIGRQPLSRRE